MRVCSLLPRKSSTLRFSTSSRVTPSLTRPLLVRLSSSFFPSFARTSTEAARRCLACFLTLLSSPWVFQSSLLFLRPYVPTRYSSCASCSLRHGFFGLEKDFLGLFGSPTDYPSLLLLFGRLRSLRRLLEGR